MHDRLWRAGCPGSEAKHGRIVRLGRARDISEWADLDQLLQRQSARVRGADNHDMGKAVDGVSQSQKALRRHIVGEGRTADGKTRPCMLQEGRDLGGAIGHVNRRENRADHRRSEVGDGELRHIGNLDGEDIALAQPQRGECARKVRRTSKRLAVIERLGRSHDGSLVGCRVRVSEEPTRYRVAVPDALAAHLFDVCGRKAHKLSQTRVGHCCELLLHGVLAICTKQAYPRCSRHTGR